MARPRWAGAAVAAALALIPASSAEAAPPNIPWSDQVPPQGVDARSQPKPPKQCRKPRIDCVRRVVRRMTKRWDPLDTSCDHRAVFALTYLRTTEGFFRTIRANKRFFRFRQWVIFEDVIFEQYYYRAYDAYLKGKPVPGAWRIAFDTATGNRTGVSNSNAGQDLFLGMNAHIQRDLPFVLANVGLKTRGGETRKPDHDKVNQILASVVEEIQEEIGRRYDPLITQTDGGPLPIDEQAALELLKSWRETAWRNAERLLNAKTQEERREVARSIEEYSTNYAQSIKNSSEIPGYGPSRDAYCKQQHAG